MFRIDGGVVNDTEVDLFTNPNEAKDCAKLIVEACLEDDRYANPNHPRYDDSLAEQTREEYEQRFANTANLHNISLNPDDDYVFLEVFDYLESGPDISMIGPVTEKMQAIYEKHEAAWSVMSEYEKTDFLAHFSENQPDWSSHLQFHYCLARGLSYRHILHEMKRRGITDRSFIKADYSLLFYLEDYEAWEQWSKQLETALMERNVRKTRTSRKGVVSAVTEQMLSVSSHA